MLYVLYADGDSLLHRETDEPVIKQDVEFMSQGVTLRGWLYIPEGEGPHPAVVVAHSGLTGVKEGFLHHDFPGVIAGGGFIVVVYDHPTLGASDGLPRGDLDPIAQQRAYRDAITFLLDRSDVDADRVGIWGTSYSGGHVLEVAASDRRIKAVVAQVPTISGRRNTANRHTPEVLAELRHQWAEDRLNTFRGGEPMRMQPLPDVNMFSSLPPECSVNWRNQVTIRTMEMYAEYEPAANIDKIGPTALCMIICDQDAMTSTEDEVAAFERALEPKSLVVLPGGHHVVYFEEFERASAAARDWFIEHLKA